MFTHVNADSVLALLARYCTNVSAIESCLGVIARDNVDKDIVPSIFQLDNLY